jgi:hypothetical protein
MLQAPELAAKAELYEQRAEAMTDPLLAFALRQRARQWRDMAAELKVLQSDPAYRAIHDGLPETGYKSGGTIEHRLG